MDPLATLATVSWLGTENISIPAHAAATFSGLCRPGCAGMSASDPIRVLSTTPHMHQYGNHFKVEDLPVLGSPTAIFDRPFDVNNQAWIETRVDVSPGDALRTTCSYLNTSAALVPYGSPFGGGEMCYGFVMHYPAHALDNGTRSLLGARNSCL
jgi:hypothetical protein